MPARFSEGLYRSYHPCRVAKKLMVLDQFDSRMAQEQFWTSHSLVSGRLLSGLLDLSQFATAAAGMMSWCGLPAAAEERDAWTKG